MGKRDLIITGGNQNFFSKLKVFVRSLREKGEYDGRVVICDNNIGGGWNSPTSYIDEETFGDKEKSFFKSYGVEVERFHELVDRHGIHRDKIESVDGGTARYPYKFIYTSLISKENIDDTEYICYIDADVYFQSPVERILKKLKRGKVAIAKERKKIGSYGLMEEWISETDLSFGTKQERFLREMSKSDNFCTGFFASDASTFNKFTLLCWMLASNRLTQFYSDQPLANILFSFFEYPLSKIGKDLVIHLGDIPEDELYYEDGKLGWKGHKPSIVHFNGSSSGIYKSAVKKLESNSADEYFVPSRPKRSKMKIKRFLDNQVLAHLRHLVSKIY